MIKLFISGILLFSTVCHAGDWGGSIAPIEKLFVYPSYIVVVQGANYAGDAGCNNDKKMGFSWSEFDEQTGDRIYATLLTAYMEQIPVRIIFHETGCTAEGAKHMNGQIAIP